MVLKTIDAELNRKLRYLLIERVDDLLTDRVEETADLTGLQLQYEADAMVEPLTRHCVSGQKLHLSNLGYGTYSWSRLPSSRIGRYCSIAENVRMMGPDHPTEWASTHSMVFGPVYREKMRKAGFADFDPVSWHRVKKPRVDIGHDVWIGRDVVLARQITIGTGAIIAGSAVVTKDVPPYAIVGGVPAKIIRYRLPEDLIASLAATEWWNYRMSDFGMQKFNNPKAFIDEFEARKDRLQPLPDAPIKVVDLVADDFKVPDRVLWL